jgi:hypothetical protein
MHAATALLPRSLSRPRVSARLWLALAAGAGCAVCAYAGLYPRFDDGALRLVLAITSAPFAAAVVAAALSAKTAATAFGRALMLAVLLGVASTIVPAALLSRNHPSEFFVACLFGSVFGAVTGAFYGVPLGILAALGHRSVRAQTHAATDRAACVAGIWGSIVALLGLTGTYLLDQPRMDYATDAMITPSPMPAFAAGAAALAGVIVVVCAVRRMRRRHAWIARVRSGLEPAFRVRHADLRDPIDALPRLGDGSTVVEFVADAASETTAGAAYRVAASGVAVAIVDDDRSMVA